MTNEATKSDGSKVYVCEECYKKIEEQKKSEETKEKLKPIIQKVMDTYNDNLKKSFGHPNWQPQSPLLLSKVDKQTAQELLPLIKALPDHDKEVRSFHEYFPFGIHVLSRKVKEEEVKDLRSIYTMMEESYGDKHLKTLAQVIQQLEEIITAKDEEKAEKCEECGKELYTRKISRGVSESTETNEITYQGRKICVDCHHKLVREENENKNQEPRPNPTNEPKPNSPAERNPNQNQPNPLQNKPVRNNPPSQTPFVNLGADYNSLKPQQQEDRKAVDEKWKNEYTKKPEYQRSSLCPYCQTNINYDKSKENFLDAKTQVKSQLEAHKKVCPKKGNKSEIKSALQAKWDEIRKSKKRMFKTCKKCWGKIRWDKSIEDAERAQKQCLTDLKKHKKKECGVKPKSQWSIKVYQSPGTGGDEHAEIPNDLKVEGKVWEEDSQGEIYQQNLQPPKKNYWPLIGGIGLVIIGIIGLAVWFLRKKKIN